MDIEQMLQQTGAIEAISRDLGVDQGTARAGAEALLPSILSGFQQPAANQHQGAAGAGLNAAGLGGALGGLGGLGGLLGTIGGLGGGGLLDNVTSSQPTQVGKGNDILGQIFGSKDRSRSVATDAAQRSGVEPTLLKKMLPILGMVVAGYVMKQAGGGFGGMPGGPSTSPAGTGAQAPAGGGVLGELIGAAGQLLRR